MSISRYGRGSPSALPGGEGRYCLDVLQQISAAQAALDKVALALVDDHTRHCVLGADPENQEAKREELMTALARLVGRR